MNPLKKFAGYWTCQKTDGKTGFIHREEFHSIYSSDVKFIEDQLTWE
jgi:hypothetical protein